MRFLKTWLNAVFGIFLVYLIAGCSTTGDGAPIIDRTGTKTKVGIDTPNQPEMGRLSNGDGIQDKDWRPRHYRVKKGDTLTEIALNHGLSYRELAKWNNISNPDLIGIGMKLRLTPRLSSQTESGNNMAAKKNLEPSVIGESKDGRSKYISWIWPLRGKIIYEFGAGENTKGVGIASNSNLAVVASAPGIVVYSGNGIRAYGKMIIIKHNFMYLSVYAHNRLIMVKEGQSVAQGQKISEIYFSSNKENGLHFEIRRRGRPVDPKTMLPSTS